RHWRSRTLSPRHVAGRLEQPSNSTSSKWPSGLTAETLTAYRSPGTPWWATHFRINGGYREAPLGRKPPQDTGRCVLAGRRLRPPPTPGTFLGHRTPSSV